MYIMVFLKDELCAVLPLVDTGKAWVSLPHFSYGGFILKEGKSVINNAKVLDDIMSACADAEPGFYRYDFDSEPRQVISKSKNIFIRSIVNIGIAGSQISEKATSIIELPNTNEELWSTLSPNLRRKINKSKQSKFIIKTGKSELLDDFYKVYTNNIKQLKSLNYSKKFFSDIVDNWVGDWSTEKMSKDIFFVAYSNEKPVAAAMLLSYQGFNENVFFSTLSKYRKEYISDLLHWEMITYCIGQKKDIELNNSRKSIYSFGRSTIDSGVYTYKNHWPVTNYPLYIHSNYSDIRKKGWLLDVWGKLPSFITKPLGAKLIKHIY